MDFCHFLRLYRPAGIKQIQFATCLNSGQACSPDQGRTQENAACPAHPGAGSEAVPGLGRRLVQRQFTAIHDRRQLLHVRQRPLLILGTGRNAAIRDDVNNEITVMRLTRC